MGFYKNDAVPKTSPTFTRPLKTLADVERLTLDRTGPVQQSASTQPAGNIVPADTGHSSYSLDPSLGSGLQPSGRGQVIFVASVHNRQKAPSRARTALAVRHKITMSPMIDQFST